jgi:ATP-dependent DNA helicase RecQ
LLPFALDFCQARKIERDPKGIKTNNIVLIVSPLISLMKDQIAKLEHFGITAINLAEAKDALTKQQLLNGEFTYIFGSPEAFLSTESRQMLKSKMYKENVVGVFIDESHCVAKWLVQKLCFTKTVN